jgi:hypothetical protein
MSDSRTQAAIPTSSTFNPASQLSGNRPFVVPSQAHETNASQEPGQFQKLDAGVMNALGIQAQLAIGAPGDKYEQEADASRCHRLSSKSTHPRLNKNPSNGKQCPKRMTK